MAAFSCGAATLDRYLHQLARQDVKRGVATAFVCVDAGSGKIAGFYTLSAFSVRLKDVPADLQKRLPRYPDVPAVLLGRLARDLKYRGAGCGELLLLDALQRTYKATSQVAAFAVVVDAKDAHAAEFYGRYGFRFLQDQPGRLFLPLRQLARLFGGNPSRDGA